MRELTLEEIELVAGGQETSDGGYDGGDVGDGGGDGGGDGDGGDGGDGGDIVVTGNPGDDGDDGDYDDGDDGDSDAGGDGGDIVVTGHRGNADSSDGGDSGDIVVTANNPHQQQEQAKNTPCVHTIPDGVDEQTLNNMAKYLGDKLHGLHAQDPQHMEYAAFIYKGADGQLYESDPVRGGLDKNGEPAEVTIHASDFANIMPSGVDIVGFIHTHPDETTGATDYVDQREPSVNPGAKIDDARSINGLEGTNRDGEHFDSDMVTYINDTQDGKNNTYAYDRNHLRNGQGDPGCSL